MIKTAVDALKTMEFREEDAWIKTQPLVFDALLEQAKRFPAFALPDADNPVTVCGIVPIFGVAEIWMVSSPDFPRHAKSILSMQRRLVTDMYAALDLHCLFMRVDAGRVDAQRWAGALGFSYEATLARRGVRGNDVEEWIWSLK